MGRDRPIARAVTLMKNVPPSQQSEAEIIEMVFLAHEGINLHGPTEVRFLGRKMESEVIHSIRQNRECESPEEIISGHILLPQE